MKCVKKLRFLGILFFAVVFFRGSLCADQRKADVFNLGYTAAGPCALDLEGDGPLSAIPGIIGGIQNAMAEAQEITELLVLDGAAIEAFRRSCPGFSVPQYRQESRRLLDDLQDLCRQKFGETAAVMFTMGVWMRGAECLARSGSGFDRNSRPGTYSLVRRNVGWMQENAAGVGLRGESILSLRQSLDRSAGMRFSSISASLVQILEDWRGDLRSQPSFAAVLDLFDDNWASEVAQSDLPVLVLLGQSGETGSQKTYSAMKELLKDYSGQVRLGYATERTCPRLYRTENISRFPLLRLYKSGKAAAFLEGIQSAETIKLFLDENLGSGVSLLGIEMPGPVKKKVKKKKKPPVR
jgi:hypothetical protein